MGTKAKTGDTCRGLIRFGEHTCSRSDVGDGLSLHGSSKGFRLLVPIICLLLFILKGLVDELHMQLALAPLSRNTRLRNNQ